MTSVNVGLLLKALVKKANKPLLSHFKPPNLNGIDPIETSICIDPEHWKRYAQCTGWLIDESMPSRLHPCYLQTLSLTSQLTLLVSPSSPFPTMGLVHIRNRIRQSQALDVSKEIAMVCNFGEVKAHPKGWQFEVHVSGVQSGEEVYHAIGTYFCRWKAPHVGASGTNDKQDVQCPDVGMLRLDASREIGFHYAKISGDFNPIHLHPVCARWFGFQSNIAHGMWSLASAYSALITHLPEMAYALDEGGVVVETDFMKPWFLPGQGELHYCDRSGNGLDIMLKDEATASSLFAGNIRPIDSSTSGD